MRILVLGGDGYLGWPQALYLSARGHDVPHLLNEDSISELLEQAARHNDCVDATMLAPRVDWRRLRNPVCGQA
ncbi:MAG: hypothetical protein ACRDQ5_04770 [Sciscionella sp.]